MLGQVHDHIVSELGESSRTDTIFVLTAIVFNLIVLGVNSGVSAAAIDEPADTTTYDLILTVFIALTALVNAIAVAALTLGRRTRRMLLGGLVAMYRDNEVDKYYDGPHVELRRALSPLHRGNCDAGSHGDYSPGYHPLHRLSVAFAEVVSVKRRYPSWIAAKRVLEIPAHVWVRLEADYRLALERQKERGQAVV